jgi:hypothetical protein
MTIQLDVIGTSLRLPTERQQAKGSKVDTVLITIPTFPGSRPTAARNTKDGFNCILQPLPSLPRWQCDSKREPIYKRGCVRVSFGYVCFAPCYYSGRQNRGGVSARYASAGRLNGHLVIDW